MIQFQNVSYSVGLFSLTGVSFSFGRGLNLIQGRSGSGKTTLLRLMSGEIPPQSGVITPSRPDLNGQMSYLPSGGLLNRTFSLAKNLDLLSKAGILIDEKEEACLLADFSFDDKKEIPLFKLSVGNIALANLIFALSKPSAYLLLDEPFASLDRLHRQQAKNVLLALSFRKCIILVDHSGSVLPKEATAIYDVEANLFTSHGALQEVAEQTSRPEKKARLFALGLEESKRRKSASVYLALLVGLSLGCVSIGMASLPKSKDQIDDFVAHNDSHDYLELDTSSPEAGDFGFWQAKEGVDCSAFLNDSPALFGRGETHKNDQIFLCADKKLTASDTLYYSVNDGSDFELASTYASASLTLTLEPYPNGKPALMQSYLGEYGSLPEDGTRTYQQKKVTALLASPILFNRLLKDEVFTHLSFTDGESLAKESLKLFLSEDHSAYLPYLPSFLEGTERLAIPGLEANVPLWMGDQELRTSEIVSGDPNTCYLSLDFYERYLRGKALNCGTTYGLLFPKSQRKLLEGSDDFFVSAFDGYFLVGESATLVSSLALSFGGIFSVLLWGYLLFFLPKLSSEAQARIYREMGFSNPQINRLLLFCDCPGFFFGAAAGLILTFLGLLVRNWRLFSYWSSGRGSLGYLAKMTAVHFPFWFCSFWPWGLAAFAALSVFAFLILFLKEGKWHHA